MSNFKYIFFDWDGTLADTYDVIRASHEHILAQLDLDVPQDPQWFYHYFGRNRDYIYKSLYGDLAPQAQPLFLEFLQARHLDFVKPYEGAQYLLQTLKNQGCVLGIITNKFRHLAEAEVQHFGWADYFSLVLCAGDAEEDKPSAKPLELALQRLDYQGDRDDVLMVGDTKADMECSRGAGVSSVYLQHFMGDYPADEIAQPSMKFTDCAHFLSFFAK